MEAATRVFLRHGFSDTSVDAIAAEAGVAKQTVFNQFGSKDGLFTEVIRATQRRIGAGMPEAMLAGFEEWLAASDDLAHDLRSYGREAVKRVLREEVLALRRLIIAEWDRRPDLLHEWARTRPVYEQVLARAIARQAERGTLEVANPLRAAHQLNVLLLEVATARSLFGRHRLSDAEIEEVVDSGIQLWMGCYASRAGR